MRENIKKMYFDKIKEVEVERAKGEDKRMGSIKIYLDASGRVVTEDEWIDLKKRDKHNKMRTMTLGEILDEFADFAKYDEVDFSAKFMALKKKMKDEGMSEEEIEEKIKKRARSELGDYYKNIDRNERLALALVTKVAMIRRDKLNQFSQTQPAERIKRMMRDSLKLSLGEIYGLSGPEIDMVDDAGYYSTHPLLIAARNNTSYNEKVNQGTWYTDFGKVLALKRGEHPDRLGLFGHINALSPGTLWEQLNISEPGEPLPGEDDVRTLLEEFQGGKTMHERCERDNSGWRKNKDVSRESLQSIFNRAFVGGGRIISILTDENVMSFDDVMRRDPYTGRLVFDPEKARKASDKWWEPIKDFCDRAEIADYKRKIYWEGREMTIEERMFSDKILKAKETMKNYYEWRATWAKSEPEKKEYLKLKGEIDKKPGLAVFTFLAADTIYRHSNLFSGIYEMWDIEEVNKFASYLDEMFKKGEEVTKDGRREYEHRISKIPLGIVDEVMTKTKKKSRTDTAFWLILLEMAKAMATGAVSDVWKEIGEGYLKSVQAVRTVS